MQGAFSRCRENGGRYRDRTYGPYHVNGPFQEKIEETRLVLLRFRTVCDASEPPQRG